MRYFSVKPPPSRETRPANLRACRPKERVNKNTRYRGGEGEGRNPAVGVKHVNYAGKYHVNAICYAAHSRRRDQKTFSPKPVWINLPGCNVCREYLTRLRPVHRVAMYISPPLKRYGYVRDYSGFCYGRANICVSLARVKFRVELHSGVALITNFSTFDVKLRLNESIEITREISWKHLKTFTLRVDTFIHLSSVSFPCRNVSLVS